MCGILPAGAVRLGQKLCKKKDGSEIKYPKQELPDATKWGPEKYDFNYRDNNRINTHETGTAPLKVLVLLILQYKVILNGISRKISRCFSAH